ncbi:helix-turn-helix domain-containing protein [Niabella sp. CJ426]|uniref:helix-turn-helix domain-containing protein n=1 Tax=Niabella sp. CJ426 TaxID=3393740 RepID=UPI003CFED8A7
MKYRFGVLALFMHCFLCIKALAQDPEAYSSIYRKTFLETAQTDMAKAHEIADSLFTISTTPQFKAKSLMLSATLYEQQQQLEKSTQIAEQAYTIISETNDFSWQVRVCGFLASQYRILQLYKKSKIYCDRALKLIPQIPQPEAAQSAAGLVNQELSYYYMAAKNYQAAIRYIEVSKQSFDKVSQNKDFFQANNEQLLGLSYYHLNQPEKAMQHYRKGLTMLKQMPDNHVRGLMYNGMSAVYIQKSDTANAKKYLDSANAIAGRSQYLRLKNEILKTTQSYFLKVKDLARFEEAREKQDSIREQIAQRNTRFLDSSFVELEKTTQQAQQNSNAKNVPLAAGGLMLVFGGSYFYFYRRKQKQQHRLFTAYFEDKKQFDPAAPPSKPSHYLVYTEADDTEGTEAITADNEALIETAADAPTGRKQDSPLLLSEETLQRILNSLSEFEAQQQFTSGTITLSQMAAQINTNIKYLSYVIKTYKGRDFNGYINELRVDYIIRQLKEQSQWRSYKISVLAEKAGFSSHGKFATIFKGVTGLSPSVFIQHLENEERK